MFLTCLASLAIGLQTPATTAPQAQTPPVTLPTVKAAPASDTVVGTYGSKSLKASDVEAFLWEWRGKEAVQDLINYNMVKDYATANGVSVTAQEIDERMRNWYTQAQSQLQKGQTMDQFMMSKGVSPTRLALSVERRLLLEKLARKQFDPTQFVHAYGVLIQPASPGANDVKNAATRAEAAFQELKKGAAWEAVLAKYSSDSNVIPSKGDLKWIPLAGLGEESRKAIAAAKPNDIVSPFQLGGTFVVLRIVTKGESASKEEVSQIQSQYQDALANQKFQDIYKINSPALKL